MTDFSSWIVCSVCNYTDDSTLFVCNKNLDFVLNELEQNSNIAIYWLQNNYMKMNSDKCHLLVVGHKFWQIWAKIGTDLIWESNSAKLLGITLIITLNLISIFPFYVLKQIENCILLLGFPTSSFSTKKEQ